jgi:hypothetical protein
MTYSKSVAPAKGNQEKGTGEGRRKVPIPSNASNQLKIGSHDELRDPMQHQSRIIIQPAPESPNYSKKSPSKRTVGRNQN